MQLTDVTLREGDQMPGRDYSIEEKLTCARALDDLGVRFIQPGFPATGEKDQTVVSTLSGTVDADLVALSRAIEHDVDVAVEAGADVVEAFVPASDKQLDHILGTSREEMLSMLTETVDYIVDRGARPHVTLADAFRTDHDALAEIFEQIPRVEFVNLADSVGARTPPTVRTYLDRLGADVDFSRVGVHFHEDMGCGTANALAAYEAGVGKADVSVGSVGERSGNSSLEELVVACAVDFDDDLGLETGDLVPTCRTILETLGEGYDERKPVLGEKIAEHESGIHTAAMLSDPAALEPYDPGAFGGRRRLIFGTPTGKSGARKLLERRGIGSDEDTVEAFADRLAQEGPLDLEDALALAGREFGD